MTLYALWQYDASRRVQEPKRVTVRHVVGRDERTVAVIEEEGAELVVRVGPGVRIETLVDDVLESAA